MLGLVRQPCPAAVAAMEARMTDDAMSPGTMCCAVSFRMLEILPKPEGKEKYKLFSNHDGSHGGAGGVVGRGFLPCKRIYGTRPVSAHPLGAI